MIVTSLEELKRWKALKEGEIRAYKHMGNITGAELKRKFEDLKEIKTKIKLYEE